MLAVLQLDPKHSVRQSLQHLCHDLYRFFLRHILSEWNYDAADKLRIIASAFIRGQTAACSRGVFDETRVKTSGPSSVIAIVCSAWALGFPSTVTTVHPSAKTFVKCVPWLTIGSIANTYPALIFGPSPGRP